MDHPSIQEILACLCGERTVYPYYRDRYSIGLLRHLSRYRQVATPLSVASLKKSAYAPLLHKPRVKSALARLGHEPLDESFLSACDHDPDPLHFILTLSSWGSDRHAGWRHRQTSRPGMNLVLQLNFSREHDLRYRQLGCRNALFNYHGHPVSASSNTLAWARIDLDLAGDCALIEEIQSDWVRSVAWLAGRVERKLAAGQAANGTIAYRGYAFPLALVQDYCRYILERYAPIWAEAMLWASIQFIREELGLRQVFYHSEAGGRALKGIRHSAPPRSLYTDLPRRFCFAPTQAMPPFLAEDKEVRQCLRQHPEILFFSLDREMAEA
ncbi:MAG: hypothetical protein D3M94_16360 [Rhodocyclales bacterium GT-UBC]|nr:MAG: hypothetical protein D3M94_16360 [Rhodocyclales bacterium GT-UBC]